MKIKQVEELVGITSKNIRFYEEQGLLTPERAENGYREYHEENIKTLKKIKLLRKLGVSVEEIKSVLSKSISLEECLENQMRHLEKERENLNNMQKLSNVILQKKDTVDTINTDEWLDEMEKMEKEGVDFVDVSKIDIHMKKKMGATIGGVVMIILMLFMIGLILFDFWGWMTDPEMPIGIFLLLLAVAVAIAAGTLVAVFNRMKEIDGGEEDEAAKY